MQILHYSLGLPPYRSGGLTRYATDLMKEQVREGYQVSLIYPGGVSILSTKLKCHKWISKEGITAYEISNSLPVPLYHGVGAPLSFLSNDKNEELYEKILDEMRPSVLHVHSLMGLSIGLLMAAKSRGIRIVMTSHDFYGLCLKCTFVNNEGKLCDGAEAHKCALCNLDAKSLLFIRTRNEPRVISIKNSVQKYLHGWYFTRKTCDKSKKRREITNCYALNPILVNEYRSLLSYYDKLFGYINIFHFNSGVTERQYRKALGKNVVGKVVPITNYNIKDNRNKGFSCGKTLKMVFIGHTDEFKGFPLLKSVLMDLIDYDWQLDVWGAGNRIDSDTPKIRFRGSYSPQDLPAIYGDCAIAIVPSIWFETFSFVTLEALSYGVPVLVSDKVGAQTVVAEYDRDFIFHSKEGLKNKLELIMKDRGSLYAYHEKILTYPWHHEMEEHCKELTKNIYNLQMSD